MSDDLSLRQLIGLLPVGMALLAAVRLVFGWRGQHGDDSMQRGMNIGGWMLVHLGVLGIFGFVAGGWTLPLWLAYLVVAAMAVGRHRQNERRALLSVLTASAARGIPLEQAARAFAHERRDDVGARAARLADALEQGATLPQALRAARTPLPMDAHLAAHIGWQVGGLGAALGQAAEFCEEFDLHLRGGIEKFLYLCWIAAVAVMVATFIIIKIIPVYTRMFMEFEIELPPITILLIDGSDFAVTNWFLVAPFSWVLVIVACVAPFYYIGWLHWEPFLLRHLWRRVHTAWILHALAITVRRRRSLLEGLQLLTLAYPPNYIAARLYHASGRVYAGEHWCDALLAEQLIRPTDAAVLRSAEQAGNLPWAMEEMAESHLRRMSYRLRTAITLLFPGLILLLAVPLFFFVVGLFLPLINLIQNLV